MDEDTAYREKRAQRIRQEGRNQPRGNRGPGGKDSQPAIAPPRENVSYGPHERNVLDFWKAESETPTPVVVFIHGGGFINGSKDQIRRRGMWNVSRCLENGVSFASISYRLRTQTTLDMIMLDCARAIQFLRSKAEAWNIDKTRFAAYGGSAGGGASLWLAVHDDVADPDSPDPVLRESSRLTVAGHVNSQATYDCEKWADIVGVSPEWLADMGMRDDLDFYGVENRDAVNSARARAIRQKVDMPEFMDPDDPPLFLINPKSLDAAPDNRGIVIHHPKHAEYLKKRCDQLGIEAILVTGDTPPEERVDMLDFFFEHFEIQTQSQQ